MDKTILYKFFEGTASFEEEESIKEWMEESSKNRKTLLKERKIFDSMLLLGNCENIKIEVAGKYRFLRIELMKVAAVIFSTLALNTLYHKLARGDEYMAMQTITVPAGQRTNLILPDGTNIWLNARTTIQYPVSFNSNERRVKLDGEAYFDVAKDKKKPFIVETAKYNIEVLGTKFDVNAYSKSEKFETSLMKGSVKVFAADKKNELLTLKPDNKAILQDGKLKMVKMDDFDYYRWKEGLVCFKNASFISIMQEFEKYYGVSINVENNNVQDFSYTGKFRQIEGLEHALRVLQMDIHFEYSWDMENQKIYIK